MKITQDTPSLSEQFRALPATTTGNSYFQEGVAYAAEHCAQILEALPSTEYAVVPRQLTPNDISEICYNVNRKRSAPGNLLSPDFLTEIHRNIVHHTARYPLTAFVDPSRFGDLPQRCAEIKTWRQTGIYSGTALAELATQERFTVFEDMALRRAEEATLLEAASVLAQLHTVPLE